MKFANMAGLQWQMLTGTTKRGDTLKQLVVYTTIGLTAQHSDTQTWAVNGGELLKGTAEKPADS